MERNDLISRTAAIAEIEEYLQGLDSCISEPDIKLDGYKNRLLVALDELKRLPVVDAVPVQCKNCKYGLHTGLEYLCDKHSGHDAKFGEDRYYKESHDGNWFCADGIRKENHNAD